MRLRNITGSREMIGESRFVIHDPKNRKNRWRELFGNSHPLQIEIGMGKGRFIMELARSHPEINYVGIEKYSSVLVRGIQKMEAEQEPLPNLYFIRMDAEEITEVFGQAEVDKIYLNFSDPWPKDRHAKRRLPSREFLNRYREILCEKGTLEFKTDNQALFTFALEELKPACWHLDQVTYDLHHDKIMMKDNVMTEYEERFSSMGNPIYKYIISMERRRKMEYTFTAENFEKEVLSSEIPVFVDFYADWCGPCKMMAPVVEKLAEKYEGKVKVGKCNIDNENAIAAQYGVMSIPTMSVFVNGKTQETIVGAVPGEQLEEMIEKFL